MTDKDILISDLNDISEILNNNGYGGWCETIRKAVELLKEQEAVEPRTKPSGGWLETKTLCFCGACGARISKRKTKFCQECGTAVKWT